MLILTINLGDVLPTFFRPMAHTIISATNAQRLYDIAPEEFKLVDEYELEVGADVPMSICVDVPVSRIRLRTVRCQGYGADTFT